MIALEEERKEQVSDSNMIAFQNMNDHDFIQNMPSLRHCAKMSDNKVFIKLSQIPSSDYYGVNPIEIAANVGFNEALRHLHDLVLFNDKKRSNLFMVSEKSIES